MANATKVHGETSGPSGQEARKLVQEVRRIQHTMKLEDTQSNRRELEGWRRSSVELQNFILESNCSGDWKQLESELEKRVEQQGEGELEVEGGSLNARLDRLGLEVQARKYQNSDRRYGEGRRHGERNRPSSSIECFRCGETGHIARYCSNVGNKCSSTCSSESEGEGLEEEPEMEEEEGLVKKESKDVTEKDIGQYLYVVLGILLGMLMDGPRKGEKIYAMFERVLNEWCGEWGVPEEVLRDEDGSFGTDDIHRMLNELMIRLNKPDVKFYGKDGRVERMIGVIRKGLENDKEGVLLENVVTYGEGPLF